MTLFSPTPLTSAHDISGFSSGERILDDWLKRRALANQTSGASRTFVVVNAEDRVFGFYSLAAGAVAHRDASRSIRQNMPDPIPVMVLGRLAVDQEAQGQRLGEALLQDALRRSLAVSENTGVRALLVHALSERAKQFYEHYLTNNQKSNIRTIGDLMIITLQ